MILYTKEIPPILTQNLILLDDPAENGYIFVSKATYDQALLLWGRFEGNVNTLMSFCKGDPDNWKDVPWILPAMKWVKENAPEPLNMLAPALKLAANLKTVTEENLNAEFIYGILHTLSQTVDFNAMYLTPSEIRAKVSIPTAILTSYKVSWENLLEPLKQNFLASLHLTVGALAGDYEDDEDEDRLKNKNSKKSSKKVVEDEDEQNEEPEDSDSEDDEDEEDEDAYWARLMAESAAEAAVAVKESMSNNSSSGSTGNNQTAAAPTVQEQSDSLEQKDDESDEANAVLNEFDM